MADADMTAERKTELDKEARSALSTRLVELADDLTNSYFQNGDGTCTLSVEGVVDYTQNLKLAAASLSQVPEGWRDIQTAPKDSTNIIVTNGVAVGEAWLCEDDGNYYWANCYPTDATDGCVWGPSHWQPLPAAPSLVKVTE